MTQHSWGHGLDVIRHHKGPDAQSEPPMGTVVLQATIPYYWRTAMAVIHGTLALVVASVLKVRYQPPAWLCGVVIAVAAVAMVMVP